MKKNCFVSIIDEQVAPVSVDLYTLPQFFNNKMLDMKKKLLVLSLLLFTVFLLNAQSATYNWNGQNGVGNWSYSNNWYYNTVPTYGSNNDIRISYNNNSETSMYYDLGWNDIRALWYESTFTTSMPLNGNGNGLNAVSYTHLTLPTIYSV